MKSWSKEEMSKWRRKLYVLLIDDEQELKNLRMWYKLGCDPKMFQVPEIPRLDDDQVPEIPRLDDDQVPEISRLDDDKVDIAWKNRCPSEFNLLETVFSAILFPFTICGCCVPSNMSDIPSPGGTYPKEHSLYKILLFVHKYHLEEKEGSDLYDYEFLWWNGKRSSA